MWITKQYTDLENLYKMNKDNLTVIGVPYNQFGGQEPGDENEIMKFVKIILELHLLTEKLM